MTRNLPKILGAVAVVSTMAIGTAAPSMAQGVYFGGPGVEIGVGPRWHHRDYYYDHGPRYHRYWRHGYSNWD
jgi:hypothetical protein